MAYDFSGVKSISIGNREVTKITKHLTGDVIWEKPYVWERYELIKTISGYTLKTASSLTDFTAPTSGYMYKTAEVDQNTGEIVLSDTDITDMLQASYGYWNPKNNYGYWKAVRGSRNYDVYFKAKEGYFKYNYSSPVNKETSTAYKLIVSSSYSYSRGNYIENVISNKSYSYPDNGRHGDYWYVKIS